MKRRRNITEKHRNRILQKLHPKNEFLGMDFETDKIRRRYYKVKCLDCNKISLKTSQQIAQRCRCDKMSDSRIDTETYLKRLHPDFSFVKREGKKFVCKCIKCNNLINKWGDTLKKPCKCNKKLKTEFVKEKFTKEGYEPLFESFNGCDTKLPVKCPEGHFWEVKYGDFYTGHRCGRCSSWKNEKICIEIAERLTGKKFTKKKLLCMTNPNTNARLELDGFNEELKLAIEYNGEQHYYPIDWFGGKENYEKCKERDILKIDLCKKNEIRLIVVPFFVENKEEYIKSELSRLGVL